MPKSVQRLTEAGFSTVIVIIIIIVILALLIVNGFGSIVKEEDIYPTPSPRPIVTSCCDDPNCELLNPSIAYNGKTYKLLKSDVVLSEGRYHLLDSGKLTSDGKKIFLNNTQDIDHSQQCDQRVGQDDLLFSCSPIPNDALIYVCKTGCIGQEGYDLFDSYFQSDPPIDIPDSIKNCDGQVLPGAEPGAPGTFRLIQPSPAPTANESLQLRYVEGKKRAPQSIPWLSPWCKPAIYLYPEEKTKINVKVNPFGKMTLTIPHYTNAGWNVTSYPDGKIEHKDGSFDYLYYEAEIPDEKIKKPTRGFVRKYSEVKSLLKEILPKLGLNENESNEFISYWTLVLPQASYYFIGMIPEDNLNQIAPLSISPEPDKVIRVTIYFQALGDPQDVQSPVIQTPKRNGFTVVEWGGIFKKDPKYPFSCFM